LFVLEKVGEKGRFFAKPSWKGEGSSHRGGKPLQKLTLKETRQRELVEGGGDKDEDPRLFEKKLWRKIHGPTVCR